MSNHPCGLCGTLHFNSSCPGDKNHDHDNYAIIICDPKRGHTARDCEGLITSTIEANEMMRGFHDEVVVKHHHNPLGKLKSFAFYYRKGVLVGVIAPSKKVDR